MRLMLVKLGVPGLGILEEEYDFDNPASCETLDKNVEMGCCILHIKEKQMEQMTPTAIETPELTLDELMTLAAKPESELAFVTEEAGEPEETEPTVH